MTSSSGIGLKMTSNCPDASMVLSCVALACSCLGCYFAHRSSRRLEASRRALADRLVSVAVTNVACIDCGEEGCWPKASNGALCLSCRAEKIADEWAGTLAELAKGPGVE